MVTLSDSIVLKCKWVSFMFHRVLCLDWNLSLYIYNYRSLDDIIKQHDVDFIHLETILSHDYPSMQLKDIKGSMNFNLLLTQMRLRLFRDRSASVIDWPIYYMHFPWMALSWHRALLRGTFDRRRYYSLNVKLGDFVRATASSRNFLLGGHF